jgi:regulator of protease activity HflC (stomatin/prohibitin superfamily)
MELFQLIANFLQGITSWLPRPYLVNVTERAVRFRRGEEPVLVEPGFRWFTPLFSSVEAYSLLKDAVEFEPVVLPTKDGKTLGVGFVVVWHLEPEDVLAAATTTDDLTSMIGELGESLLPPIVLSLSATELVERMRGDRGMRTVNSRLKEEAQVLLEEYGVTVDSARLNFVSPARTIRLLS